MNYKLLLSFLLSSLLFFSCTKEGLDGLDGQDGQDGKDGINGINGTDGVDGEDGKDGKDGKDGINGTDGSDGVDGTDGVVDFEVFHFDLKETDFLRNYDFPDNYNYEAKLLPLEERDDKFFSVDINEDVVFIYIKSHEDDIWGNVWTSLPSTFIIDEDNSVKIEYSIAEGDDGLDIVIIDIETLSNDELDLSDSDSEINFKVVKISGANGTFKKSNLPEIDFNNYLEVKDYFNLN